MPTLNVGALKHLPSSHLIKKMCNIYFLNKNIKINLFDFSNLKKIQIKTVKTKYEKKKIFGHWMYSNKQRHLYCLLSFYYSNKYGLVNKFI